MFDLRSFQNKGKVHSWFCRNILRNEDGDFRLSVRSSIQSVFFLFFFISSHISNVTLTFATRFLPSTFPSTNFESICVWCSKHLNDSLIKRLESKKETHSTVQPNFGEHSCLIQNVGCEDGWTVLRPTTKKRKPKSKLKSKSKPKSRKRKKGGSPCAKKRKEWN